MAKWIFWFFVVSIALKAMRRLPGASVGAATRHRLRSHYRWSWSSSMHEPSTFGIDSVIGGSTLHHTNDQFDDHVINPATGQPMIGGMGGIDVGGDTFGSSYKNDHLFQHSCSFSSSFDSSHDWGSSGGFNERW